MSLSASQKSVTTTPAAVILASGSGVRAHLFNAGGSPIFIGGSDVNATTHGFQLLASGSVTLDLAPGDELWALASTGTQTLHVLLT